VTRSCAPEAGDTVVVIRVDVGRAGDCARPESVRAVAATSTASVSMAAMSTMGVA